MRFLRIVRVVVTDVTGSVEGTPEPPTLLVAARRKTSRKRGRWLPPGLRLVPLIGGQVPIWPRWHLRRKAVAQGDRAEEPQCLRSDFAAHWNYGKPIYQYPLQAAEVLFRRVDSEAWPHRRRISPDGEA
jgi:hypothetical protein